MGSTSAWMTLACLSLGGISGFLQPPPATSGRLSASPPIASSPSRLGGWGAPQLQYGRLGRAVCALAGGAGQSGFPTHPNGAGDGGRGRKGIPARICGASRPPAARRGDTVAVTMKAGDEPVAGGVPPTTAGPAGGGRGSIASKMGWSPPAKGKKNTVPLQSDRLKGQKMHLKLRKKPPGGGEAPELPLWKFFGQEARRMPSTTLQVLMLHWIKRWLRGERRLHQFTCDYPPPPYVAGSPDAPVPGGVHGGSVFQVSDRYQLRGIAGKGAFAIVGWGKDLKTDTRVAIKRMGDAAPDRLAAHRLQRELSILRRLRGHPNVVSAVDLSVKSHMASNILTRERRDVIDVYLFTDLQLVDLGFMLDSQHLFSREQVRCLLWQLFRGLAHVHACGVIHRDLKPGNVLLDPLWRLEVCDLGIARSVVDFDPERYHENHDVRFTDYVVTRPYRAPELLMGSKNYTTAVDMWAAGCMMAEILAGQYPVDKAPLSRNTERGWQRLPLFPGMDHKDTIDRIVQVLGHPPPDVLGRMTEWEPRAASFVETLPWPACDLATGRPYQGVENPPEWGGGDSGAVEFHKIFPHAEPGAIEILCALLNWDAPSRPSAEQVLAHPYFTEHPSAHGFARWNGKTDEGSRTTQDIALRRAAKRSGMGWDELWTFYDFRRRRIPKEK